MDFRSYGSRLVDKAKKAGVRAILWAGLCYAFGVGLSFIVNVQVSNWSKQKSADEKPNLLTEALFNWLDMYQDMVTRGADFPAADNTVLVVITARNAPNFTEHSLCEQRRLLATMIPLIAASGTHVLVIDKFFRTRPDCDTTGQLQEAIYEASKKMPVVISRYAVVGKGYLDSSIPMYDGGQLMVGVGFRERDHRLIPFRGWFHASEQEQREGAQPRRFLSLPLAGALAWRPELLRQYPKLKSLYDRNHPPFTSFIQPNEENTNPDPARLPVYSPGYVMCGKPALETKADFDTCVQQSTSFNRSFLSKRNIVIIGEEPEKFDIHETVIGRIPGVVLLANYIESLLTRRYYSPAHPVVNVLLGLLLYTALLLLLRTKRFWPIMLGISLVAGAYYVLMLVVLSIWYVYLEPVAYSLVSLATKLAAPGVDRFFKSKPSVPDAVKASLLLVLFGISALGYQAPAKPKPEQPLPLEDPGGVPPPKKPDANKPPITSPGLVSQITGVVMDANGGLIPGARVTVTNPLTGLSSDSVTNERGEYVAQVPSGTYNIVVEAAGFKQTHRLNVQIELASSLRIDMPLETGSGLDTVTISPNVALLQTSEDVRNTTITAQQVSQLPLNGRDFTSLMKMLPGVAATQNGESGSTMRIDGVEAEMSGLQPLSPNALDVATMNRHNYETSSPGSGDTEVSTKSGTNTVHGAAEWYAANDVFGSRNFFDTHRKSPVRSQEFGASLGGPLVRSRAFVFGSYDGSRQRIGVNLIEGVPSGSLRHTSDSFLLAAFPSGAGPTVDADVDLARLNSPRRFWTDAGFGRVDVNLGDSSWLAARYRQDRNDNDIPQSVAGARRLFSSRTKEGAVEWTRSFSPTLVNYARVLVIDAPNAVSGTAPVVNGMSTNPLLVEFSGPPKERGTSGAARLGAAWRYFGSHADQATVARRRRWVVSDTVSLFRGGHRILAGVEARGERAQLLLRGASTYAFSDATALAAGRPMFIQIAPSTDIQTAIRKQISAYVNVETHLSRSITAQYGLRYEYLTPAGTTGPSLATIDPITGALRPPAADFFRVSKLAFAPRASLSLRMGYHTVLRAGGGLFYFSPQLIELTLPVQSNRDVRVQEGSDTGQPVDPGYQPRTFATDFLMPSKMLQYSTSLRREITSRLIVEASYTGQRAWRLPMGTWANPISGVQMDPRTGTGIPIRSLGNHLSTFDVLTSEGRSTRHSLQMEGTRRMAAGLTARLSWTWSHSIDTASEVAQNPSNLNGERGNSNLDIRHWVSANGAYNLPLGKTHRLFSGKTGNALFGDWIVSGVFGARTGMPVPVTIARPNIVYVDRRSNQLSTTPVVENGVVHTTPVVNTPGGSYRDSQRPDYTGAPPFLYTSDKRVMLNPEAFAPPAPGTYGNLGRNALHGPSYVRLDVRLLKTIRIREDVAVAFTADSFNVLNRANFANPPSLLPGSTRSLRSGHFTPANAGGVFGIANSLVEHSYGGGRQFRFGLRVSF